MIWPGSASNAGSKLIVVLESKLERLVDAFEAHGIPVRSNLRPGASEAELDDLAEQLNLTLLKRFGSCIGGATGISIPRRPMLSDFAMASLSG